MHSFYILFIYILFFTLKNIKSKKQYITIWENTTKSEQIPINLADKKYYLILMMMKQVQKYISSKAKENILFILMMLLIVN